MITNGCSPTGGPAGAAGVPFGTLIGRYELLRRNVAKIEQERRQDELELRTAELRTFAAEAALRAKDDELLHLEWSNCTLHDQLQAAKLMVAELSMGEAPAAELGPVADRVQAAVDAVLRRSGETRDAEIRSKFVASQGRVRELETLLADAEGRWKRCEAQAAKAEADCAHALAHADAVVHARLRDVETLSGQLKAAQAAAAESERRLREELNAALSSKATLESALARSKSGEAMAEERAAALERDLAALGEELKARDGEDRKSVV